MAKYIAHSRISENGTIYGEAGDQIGTEVCVQEFYLKPWNCVIRIDNEDVRRQFANNMIDIANNNAVGYCQSGRNSLLTEAIKVKFDFTKIKIKCECDCSSAVTICLLGAIYTVLGEKAYNKACDILVTNGNCSTTRTLKNQMLTLKKKSIVSVSVYTDASYINGTTKAVFGDIYLKEGSHVVAYVDDGKKKEKATENNASNTSNKKYTYGGVDYSLVFDPTFYMNKYNDLKKAFGNNAEALFNHFVQYGMKEGRQACDKFEVNTYRKNYSDLQKTFGSNLPAYYKHYIQFGHKEGRIAVPKKSSSSNNSSNSNSSSTSTSSTTKKYVLNGLDYSLVFDPMYYTNKYSDLKKVFGENGEKLFTHFVNFGMKEGRQAISTFNVHAYKNRYTDLQKAYGNNLQSYYVHYIRFGNKEGRNAL